MSDRVKVCRRRMTIPTYAAGKADPNPMFFEKRVYQGSCGKVYPIPFIDKVADEAKPRDWDAVTLENGYVRLVMLPEIGGRIYVGQDKTNGDYDFFYRNDVIKPALVGLAGPWISGGVEFNWPQHHRPATYMPTDVEIERGDDGSVTVWMSDHDPLDRLYARHGIRLRPGSAVVELTARLYNRTPMTHTFLWWANVAARVHEKYESFFPPDVDYVADHAVRAISSFPRARNPYYGIDYRKRPGADNLAWYRNIPVPTSYMVCATAYDFFGGYDHAKEGGFVHVADRNFAPGKKQWAWGNAPFGYAWDRELTDSSGPYVELMAGVYTDNQPDFSYLLPFETKTVSQCWWPYSKIGPVKNANRRAAVNLGGVAVSEPIRGATIELYRRGRRILARKANLSPAKPWQCADTAGADEIRVFDAKGPVIAYAETKASSLGKRREQATEPPQPKDIRSADELFITAEHLDQYRHPTRYPEPYLDELLRRDPLDSRAHVLYAKRLLRRGLFEEAKRHCEQAVERLTLRHPNPYTGEAHYCLGLAKWYLGDSDGAYAAFAKSTWNYEFRAAGERMMKTIDAARGMPVEFDEPPRILDTWDRERILDYAYEDIERGRFASARRLLAKNGDHAMSRCALAWLDLREKGRIGGRLRPERKYFFPSRPRDYVILRDLDAATGGRNAALAYALGNYCYDRKRHEEALRYWRRATRIDPKFPTAWRNLGVALWNVRRDAKGARAAYAKAIACDPKDARLVAEAAILAEKCGVDPALRLRFLLEHKDLVLTRDDATVELVSLYNETGSPEKALELMRSHRFHPWEGGEGKVLLQWARANAMLGRWASLFNPPQNLGETFHLVLDDPELKCYKAYALRAEGRTAEARRILADVRKFALATRGKPAKIDYFATSLPLVLIFEDDLEAVKNRQMERLLELTAR